MIIDIIERRIISALNDNDNEMEEVSYKSPRLVPAVVGGQLMWATADDYKIREYKEFRRGGVLLKVTFSIFDEGGWKEVSYSIPTKAA